MSEVKKKLREFRRNQDKYQPNNICRVTLAEYIRNWLYNFKRNNLKDTGFDRLERTIENQIIPVIGNFLLSKIFHNDIQKLLNKLIDSGTSYSVIKKTTMTS